MHRVAQEWASQMPFWLKLVCNGNNIADLAQCMFHLLDCVCFGRRLISTVTESLNLFYEGANAPVFAGIMVKNDDTAIE
jgi:hypothetical protein